MEKGPSRTAVRTAIHRAAHLLLDGNPGTLTDTFAGAFAGYASDADLLRALETSQTIRTAHARPSSPYEIATPRTNSRTPSGVASPNTSYLEPASIPSLIDDRNRWRRSRSSRSTTPRSQAWKRARIAELGIAPPSRLHHLPIDFERQTLGEGLAAGGLDLKIPVFFAVLGVAQYLTKGALSQMLRDIAETTAPGSELVMQFVAPLESLETSDAARAYALANRAIESGEKMAWLLRTGGDGTPSA